MISYIGLVCLGALVFSQTNRLSFIDAVYFATVTLTTVGYGDIHPTNHFGKIFCVLYVFSGFVMITFVLNTISDQVGCLGVWFRGVALWLYRWPIGCLVSPTPCDYF